MAKTWAQSEPLVAAHVKGLSIAAIQHHLKTFRKFIGHRKRGIYVLRKGRDVYYVGPPASFSIYSAPCSEPNEKSRSEAEIRAIEPDDRKKNIR
jgi:hypothetical protein